MISDTILLSSPTRRRSLRVTMPSKAEEHMQVAVAGHRQQIAHGHAAAVAREQLQALHRVAAEAAQQLLAERRRQVVRDRASESLAVPSTRVASPSLCRFRAASVAPVGPAADSLCQSLVSMTICMETDPPGDWLCRNYCPCRRGMQRGSCMAGFSPTARGAAPAPQRRRSRAKQEDEYDARDEAAGHAPSARRRPPRPGAIRPPSNSCRTNQKPSTSTAGSFRSWVKKPSGTSTSTCARGNRTK